MFGKMDPVTVEGERLVDTWWGRAWIDNLERYADLVNRTARGRAYLREGAVIDLKVSEGEARALVRGSGSTPYKVKISVATVSATKAQRIQSRCYDKASDTQALMEGRMPVAMEGILRSSDGLFPNIDELGFECSCPDSAHMCKHVAAVLYGIGVRFDRDPRLLFKLRGVPMDMFLERSMRSRLESMLDNATSIRTDRMLDDGSVKGLFEIVEHVSFRREDTDDSLVSTLGRGLHSEGLVLVDNNAVSEPMDIGDGMLKLTVTESGGRRNHVVIWRDRFDKPVRYSCGCDSDQPCRHVAAALISLDPSRDLEVDVERTLEEFTARIGAFLEDIGEIEWDQDEATGTWTNPDGRDTDAEIDALFDDMLRVLDPDDERTMWLFDDLYHRCMEIDYVAAEHLATRASAFSDILSGATPEMMRRLLGRYYLSWVFNAIDEVPHGVLESIYDPMEMGMSSDNLAELAFHLRMYGDYIEIKLYDEEAFERCRRVARMLRSKDLETMLDAMWSS